MGDFKSRPGTFLPFLEASQADKSSAQPAPATPLTLLEILSKHPQQSLPIFELQTVSAMQPSHYAEALKSLRNAGYIAIEGDAPEQTIRLTGNGAEVATLAKPA
jgi:hypothetical protein